MDDCQPDALRASARSVSIATDYSRLVSYRLNVQVEWAALIYPIEHGRKMLFPRFEALLEKRCNRLTLRHCAMTDNGGADLNLIECRCHRH